MRTWLAGEAEEAAFTGERAFGWDECLPTVAPCADPLDPGGPSLRDHGDGWGRSSEVSRLAATAAVPAGVRLAWDGSGPIQVRAHGPASTVRRCEPTTG